MSKKDQAGDNNKRELKKDQAIPRHKRNEKPAMLAFFLCKIEKNEAIIVRQLSNF